MVENKKAEGLKFLLKLDQASAEKGKLLELARDAVRESHNHSTFSMRKDLITNPNSLDINAAFARSHAMMNANFSTNDKLYLIMQRYVLLAEKETPRVSKAKALDRFIKEFAAAYPQEYGVQTTAKTAEKPVSMPLNLMLRSRGR